MHSRPALRRLTRQGFAVSESFVKSQNVPGLFCFKPLEADLNRKSFINPENIV